jgi:hypothetical protein
MPASDPSTPRGESANGASCDDQYAKKAREELVRANLDRLGDTILGLGFKFGDGELESEEVAEQLRQVRGELKVFVEIVEEIE